MARAKKDGYTLLAGSSSTIVISPIISKEATYDPLKEFIPLGYPGHIPAAYAVKSDSAFKSFGDLVEYARKNPGKLKYAGGGGANPSFFSVQLLCKKNNLKITTIPFKSGQEATVALLGGHVDMTASNFISMGSHIKAGTLRGLALNANTRHPDFPDIPSTVELGYPYMTLSAWVGVLAPAGVPQPIVDTLVSALEKAFKDPEVVQRLTATGFMVEYLGPEEFRKHIESEIGIVGELAKDVGLSKK